MMRGGIRRFFGIFIVALFMLVSISGISESAASEATLSGIVFDAQDFKPLEGVILLLENESESFVTVTADDGSYFFIDIPAGDYTIAINDSDFIAVPVEVSLGAAACESLDLTAIPADIFDVPPTADSGRPTRTAVGTKAINISGKWAGSWKTNGSTGRISMNVVQSGQKIRGNLTVTNTDCGTVTLPYKGTISGSSASLKATGSCYGYPVALVIQGVISRTKLKGTFKLYVGSQLYDSGTFNLTKR